MVGWVPPGRDCGACGAANCDRFIIQVKEGRKDLQCCPFYREEGMVDPPIRGVASPYTGADVHGAVYDFVLAPLPGEVSARKGIVPFRPDLVERWGIQAGDIVTGRPAGPGCPVYHALKVLSANPVTGLLVCHTVGPLAARKAGMAVHDVQAYHVASFEGVAEVFAAPPVLGRRQRFLPGACMINLSHTAVVNMVLQKTFGLHIRLEDIRIQ